MNSVDGTYNAVHTGRKDGRVHVTPPCTGRVHGRDRVTDGPCAWPVYGRVHSLYTAMGGHVQTVHAGRVQTVYTVYTVYTAVYKLCTRPYTGHAHGPSVSRTRPCTQPVRGKTRPGTRPEPDRVRTVYMAVHGPCTVYTAVYTAVFTARVHGRVRTMYTAMHGPSMTRTRPCTRSCTLYTAVFTARVRGRVPCTCMCLWPVYTTVHGRVQTAYELCTWSVHDPDAAAAPTRPCLQHVPCTRPFTACTDRVHHDTVHSKHRKS